MTTYPYARLYAASEKDMTETLDRIIGKGRWLKTKIMIDTYPTGAASTGNRKADKPQWNRVDDDGYEYATNVVYRGVIFRDDESASLARMFLNSVENRQPDDLVLIRSWHDVEVTPKARYWGIGKGGLPWETKDEAAILWTIAEDSR